MKCINCLYQKTSVTNSRAQLKGQTVWRRRHCSACQHVFTTIEQVDPTTVYTVKSQSSKKLVTFSRATLLLSILEVLQYANTDPESAYWLTESVIHKIVSQYRPVAPLLASHIALVAHETLSSYNHLASQAYAARHAVKA